MFMIKLPEMEQKSGVVTKWASKSRCSIWKVIYAVKVWQRFLQG